jgi:hypothetical protein
MFFARRTRQRIRFALEVSLLCALLVASIAAFFPQEGKPFLSFLSWWIVAIPVCIAAYAALELSGTWSLELPFWQLMPSWVRVLLLVAVVGFIAVFVVMAPEYYWGGNAL